MNFQSLICRILTFNDFSVQYSQNKKGVENMGKNIKENFDIILKEMFGSDTTCFDTLLAATEKDIRIKICADCKNTPVLNHGRIYEEIIQDVLIRVFLTSVPQFFLRAENGTLNTSADEYWYWVQKICKNRVRDYFNKYAKKGNSESFISEDEDEDTPEIQIAAPEPENQDYNQEQLVRHFNIVMTSGGNVYKPLTWMAQSLLVLRNNQTRIDSNEELIKIFDNMTLDEMFSLILSMAEKLDWMYLEEASVAKIRKGLDKLHASGSRMGNMQYHDFYMADGPKKSISDWVNRMDAKIKEKERKPKIQ